MRRWNFRKFISYTKR